MDQDQRHSHQPQMLLFPKTEETTFLRKVSTKTSTGLPTQILRPLTGQERRFHSPKTDLDQRHSHQLPWLKDSQEFFQDLRRERVSPRKAWTRMFTISPTINQRSQDNPIQDLRLPMQTMELDQRLSKPLLKDKEVNQDQLTTAGIDNPMISHMPTTEVEHRLSHHGSNFPNAEKDHSPTTMVLLLTTVQEPVLSHQFLMSQSMLTIKLDQLHVER